MQKVQWIVIGSSGRYLGSVRMRATTVLDELRTKAVFMIQ